jgi:choloylglycine hydrolase
VVKRLIISIFLVLASAVFYGAASACTSIALVAEDGTVVYGRTMEWGTFGLNFRVAVIPRGYQLRGHTPDGKPGRSWKARYGVVGLDALEKDIITDGMNEKGLVVGVLSPGFCRVSTLHQF